MLVSAAVLPHPPVLVPALAGDRRSELDDLREACRRAVARTLAAEPDSVYVVGADVGIRASSFAPWAPGAASTAATVAVDVPEPLPLPLLVGAWLTGGEHRSFVVVAPDLDPTECAGLGADLAGSADRVALVVMGDGSARHHEKAPGYVDVRAAPYDERVSAGLAGGDAAALAALDPDEAAELMVAGRAPWQVLAGAAAGRTWRTDGHGYAAPYGVGYHVVTWTAADAG